MCDPLRKWEDKQIEERNKIWRRKKWEQEKKETMLRLHRRAHAIGALTKNTIFKNTFKNTLWKETPKNTLVHFKKNFKKTLQAPETCTFHY